MSTAAEILNAFVPITQFNSGDGARIFERLTVNGQLIVVKDNLPAAVILSPAEYARLSELEEDHFLLMQALERLERNEGKPTISMEDLMTRYGITESDIEAAEEPLIG